MKTAEIVKALPGNQVLKMVVPQWAFRSIPFPFYKNGNQCLGFYYYPLRNEDGKHKIQAPIIQVVTSYPEGHIVSIVASPFFLSNMMSSTNIIGEYPTKSLSGLSLAESNAAYEAYYSACDTYFIDKDITKWKSEYEKVCEDGMGPFFDLFIKQKTVSSVSTAIPSPSTNQSKRTPVCSSDMFSQKSKHFLRELKNFYSQKIFSQEANELQNTLSDINREEFTMAVIGEFSRGKTTFINELIGKNVLPVGELPTTAVLTKIVSSEDETIYFIGKNGMTKQMSLTKEALESFLADSDGNDPEGVLQIQLPIPWMNNKNIRFFDTPGTGDAIGQRANIVREVISRCDCTVMAISAQSPCSLTEIEFLKENVLFKAIPRCIILITKLDTIQEQERSRLISFVKQKLSPVVPNAKYWVSHEMPGIDNNTIDAVGIQNIQESICNMFVSDDELVKEREKQLLLRVNRILDKSTKEIDIVEQTEKLEIGQKRDIVNKLIQSRNSIDTFWSLLAEKCKGRQLDAEKIVQKQLNEVRDSLLKDWNMSLQRTSSPKDWVEREFPYMAEKTVKSVRDSMTRKIVSLVMQDRAYIANEANEYLEEKGLNITLPEMEYDYQPERLDADTKNFEQTRLLTRIATIAALPALALISGGLGISLGPMIYLASGGAGLGADFFLKNKIEDQKHMIEEKLRDKVFEIFVTMEGQLHGYLEKCYSEILSSMKEESKKALSSALVKIQAAQMTIPTEEKLFSVTLRKQLNSFTEQLKELVD